MGMFFVMGPSFVKRKSADIYLSPSILISSGPFLLKLKPLSDWSNCMEEEPKSNRAPSILPADWLISWSTVGRSENRPRSGMTLPGLKNNSIYNYKHDFGLVLTMLLQSCGNKVFQFIPPSIAREGSGVPSTRSQFMQYKKKNLSHSQHGISSSVLMPGDSTSMLCGTRGQRNMIAAFHAGRHLACNTTTKLHQTYTLPIQPRLVQSSIIKNRSSKTDFHFQWVF